MRVKLIFPLLVIALLASVLVPRPAHTQQRGLGVTQTPTASHYHALVIGNDDYANLPKLKTAIADAREVERVLREAYGFQTHLLVNARRAQIVSALSVYRRELDANANLLIYYAGHGYNDKDADKAYWLPVDATVDDTSNWIIADEITTAVRVIPARHVLVISDSCYSGTLTRDLNISLPRPSEREQFLQRMAAGHSRTLMASGGNEPVADGGGSGHSVFAAALLRGLQQMDKPQFTAAELFNTYIVESVAGRAEQTPVYDPLRNSGHESGDFVFARVNNNAKPVEAIVNAPPATKIDPAQQELAFWNSIQNSTDADDFKDYLARYPNGLYAGIARRRISMLSSATKPIPTNTPSNTLANTTSAAHPAMHPQQIQNRAGIEFVWIPPGSFMMGSNYNNYEQPVHRVTISEGFYMGKNEVTQAQWQKMMGNNPSYFKGCDSCPVEQVSWDDAQEFIRRLNAQSDNYMYRLPTEAEWEYACRAGTTGDYAGALDSLAWYGNNSGRRYLDVREIARTDSSNFLQRLSDNENQTHPVGTKQPNAFGLFDMHGNVWEWCQDLYHEDYHGAPDDGRAWEGGVEQKYRVLRGGSWTDFSTGCRSTERYWPMKGDRKNFIGFRLVSVTRQ
jgi:formylglycine-generating enzyme required for sulfatase activity